MFFADYLFLAFVAVSLYFLILSLLLALREDPAYVPQAPLPAVSLVVPAHNEEGTIAQTLESLLALEYPPSLLEVLVVDDGSSDRTAKIAVKYGVKVLVQENLGKAAAVNHGIGESSGELVGVVDADSFPEPDSLWRAVSCFNGPDVAAVTSRVAVKAPDNLLRRLQDLEYVLSAWERRLMNSLGSVSVTPGPLSLYRKEVIEEVGGFDSSVLTEDIEIAWRILEKGYSIRMASDALVYTKAPASLGVWWNQRVRWSLGGLQTALKYKKSIFKPESGLFGFFVVPRLILFNLLTLTGFFLFMHGLFGSIASLIDYLYYVDALGLDLFSLLGFELVFGPFTPISFVLFAAGLSCVFLCFKSMGKSIRGLRDLSAFFVFESLYFLLSPPVLIHAMYRLVFHKKHRW